MKTASLRLRVKNYPPTHQRELRGGWTFLALFTLLFGVPAAIALYSAVTGTFDLLLATLLVSFFLLVFGFALPSCIEATLHVRVVPILERDGQSTWVRRPKALEFLTNRDKGRAIGEHYQRLVAFAIQHNITPISDFGAVNVRDSDIVYFEAAEGALAISALISSLKLHGELVDNAQTVIQDLFDVEVVLNEAVSENSRFCFAIM